MPALVLRQGRPISFKVSFTLGSETRSSGDLNRLQKTLETYVAQSRFRSFTLVTSTDVDDSAFTVRVLTLPQADAVRADFLAYNQRAKDSRALVCSGVCIALLRQCSN